MSSLPNPSDDFKNTRKSYVLASALLMAWQLIEIDGDIHISSLSIKIPNRSIPTLILAFATYLSFRMVMEWAYSSEDLKSSLIFESEYTLAHSIYSISSATYVSTYISKETSYLGTIEVGSQDFILLIAVFPLVYFMSYRTYKYVRYLLNWPKDYVYHYAFGVTFIYIYFSVVVIFEVGITSSITKVILLLLLVPSIVLGGWDIKNFVKGLLEGNSS